MSTEYIQAVSIREGQVYLTSKSNNDDLHYHTWHCGGLFKVYKEEGQLGLERDIADAVRVCDTKGQLSKHYQVS